MAGRTHQPGLLLLQNIQSFSSPSGPHLQVDHHYLYHISYIILVLNHRSIIIIIFIIIIVILWSSFTGQSSLSLMIYFSHGAYVKISSLVKQSSSSSSSSLDLGRPSSEEVEWMPYTPGGEYLLMGDQVTFHQKILSSYLILYFHILSHITSSYDG